MLLPILSAAVLLGVFVSMMLRGVAYVQRHPEVAQHGAPLAYQLCHLTLVHVVERYHQVGQRAAPALSATWHAPGGRRYLVTGEGVEAQRGGGQALYRLPWDRIGGLGIRMQPGFRFADENRDGSTDNQYTIDYSFHLLIVPLSGATIDVPIPLRDHTQAVDFVAHALVLAEQHGKRVNTFGFDKPPSAYRKRLARF